MLTHIIGLLQEQRGRVISDGLFIDAFEEESPSGSQSGSLLAVGRQI